MFWYAQPGAALSPAMPVRCGCVALTSQQAQDKTPKHSKGSAWDMTQKVHISNKNVGEGEAEEGTRCGVRSGICSRCGGESRRSDRVETSEQWAVVHVSTSSSQSPQEPGNTNKKGNNN